MTLGRIVLALLLLGLSGCATVPDISQSRSPCRTEPGGWCDFVREAAAEAYPYAVASTNAYVGDDDLFPVIGPVLRRVERLPISEEDADKGFDYQIFERLEPASARFGWWIWGAQQAEYEVTERILAFRGTDFTGLSDIFYGTLRSDQIELAVAYYMRERDREEFADGLPWVVTGHSLGGALATEVSIRYPDVRAYMFNTSPFYRGDAMTNDMRRMVINEHGELLRRFARYRDQPAANVFTLNCAPQNGTITKHKIRPLADCVTWIAAYESEDALALVEANEVRKPMVECGEDAKVHPGPGSVQGEPCVHVARLKDDAE